MLYVMLYSYLFNQVKLKLFYLRAVTGMITEAGKWGLTAMRNGSTFLRAEQSRAEQSIAEQSRAEQSMG